MSVSESAPAAGNVATHDDASLVAARKQGVYSRSLPTHSQPDPGSSSSRVLLCRLQPAIRQVCMLQAYLFFSFFFFFSFIRTDVFPCPRFMWTLHTANADHWVPIKTVSSFKRMRDHAANGHEFILHALKSSTELEVDEKGENVRRSTELQKPKDQFERSVYAVRAFSFFLNQCFERDVPT